jgi:hypothetical protein
VIKRVNRGKGHYYIDTETGVRIPGVTSIISDGLPKPALINWAATATVDYAIDHWNELGQLSVSARAKKLNGSRYESRDAAANRGTQIHALAERLVTGERVSIPEGLEGYVESYTRFLDDFDVRPVLVERTVWNPEDDYCGTFDLVADLLNVDGMFASDPWGGAGPVPERLRWLLDIKSNRSGIFGETALQLAPYRYAPYVLPVDSEDEADMEDMPTIDATGAVHVTPDGYELVPVEAGQLQYRQFLSVKEVARFGATSRDLIGAPIVPPTTSAYRLVKD